jgi:LCP family protein required for cell wall assembly
VISHSIKVAIIVAVLAVAAAGFEAYRVTNALMSITGQVVPRAKAEPKITTLPTLSGTKRINILLLGTDTSNKPEEVQQRDTDTMMVVTIDPVHHQVGMLSIPRDLWVNIPGYGYHKINAAYSLGGIRLARQTVEQVFGIPIHYYAWIGLSGFIKVVDTLGGVVVDATHPVLDDTFPNDLNSPNPYAYMRVYIPAGPQYMDGATALEYVRSRHGDLVGDFGRGARQEQILIGLRQKATTLNVLTHLPDLVADLQGSVKTDLSLPELWRMAVFARSIDPATVNRVVLKPPLYSSTGTSADGESIVIPNWDTIRPLIRQMFAEPVIGNSPLRHQKAVIRIVTHPHPLARKHTGSSRMQKVKPSAQQAKHATRFSGHLFFARDGNIWSYDGQSLQQLTHSGDASDPSLTANGKRLVYVRRWAPSVSDIFTLNLRTHRFGQITQDRTTDGDIRDNVWAYDPAYAPNGSSIIYASDRYKLANPPSDGRQIDLALYRYDVASGTTTQLTTPAFEAGGDADPRFDPANPNLLLFTSFSYQQNDDVASQLTLLNLTTDQMTSLTPTNELDLQPAWQPNGQHVAYIQTQNDGSGTRLLIAPFHNGTLRVKRAVQVDAGMIAMPTFSPDGQWLAYYKLVGNEFQLFTVDLKGGVPDGQPHALLTLSGLDATSPIIWTR